jgi:hypothetical protein
MPRFRIAPWLSALAAGVTLLSFWSVITDILRTVAPVPPPILSSLF